MIKPPNSAKSLVPDRRLLIFGLNGQSPNADLLTDGQGPLPRGEQELSP